MKKDVTRMTAGEMIEALSRLDKDAVVVFNIMQTNKAYGVAQISCHTNHHFGVDRPDERYPCVNSTYSGACVNIWLPDNAYLVQKNK